MSDLSAQRVKAFFDEVASDWDTMRVAYYDERVIEQMSSAAQLDATMTVADVGTGTGYVAAGVSPHVERVIGIDTSPEMLAVARRNLDALGITNVELIEGDVGTLSLEDDSVDAAFANMVLHHTETPRPCSPRWPASFAPAAPSRSATKSSTRTNGCAASTPT